MRKIKSLEIPNGQFTKLYVVGLTQMDNVTVAEIEDKCMGWETHDDYIYLVRDADRNVMAELVNVPVIIEYEQEDKTNGKEE